MNLILAILAMKHEHEETIDDLDSVGVIIKGAEVLYNLVSIAHALTILFGHMYSLDLPNEYMWPQMFVVEKNKTI